MDQGNIKYAKEAGDSYYRLEEHGDYLMLIEYDGTAKRSVINHFDKRNLYLAIEYSVDYVRSKEHEYNQPHSKQ